jgi:hypothetical protein
MTKGNRSRRNKKHGGGWFGFGDDAPSADGSPPKPGFFSSLSQKAKDLSGSATSSTSSWWPSSTPAAPAAPAAPVTQGGRRKRRMRGGYSDNMSTTNLASRAASFSGSTARAQAYVGGRTKRRCHKHKGSRKRHCRK